MYNPTMWLLTGQGLICNKTRYQLPFCAYTHAAYPVNNIHIKHLKPVGIALLHINYRLQSQCHNEEAEALMHS